MQASILPYKMLNHLRNYTNTKILVYIFLCPCLQHVLHNGQKYLLFLSLRNPAFQFCLSFICHLPLFPRNRDNLSIPCTALHIYHRSPQSASLQCNHLFTWRPLWVSSHFHQLFSRWHFLIYWTKSKHKFFSKRNCLLILQLLSKDI